MIGLEKKPQTNANDVFGSTVPELFLHPSVAGCLQESLLSELRGEEEVWPRDMCDHPPQKVASLTVSVVPMHPSLPDGSLVTG